MNRLLCFVLSFALVFSSAPAGAENPICDNSNEVGNPGDAGFDAACALMHDYANRTPAIEQVVRAASKCAIGGWKGIEDGVMMTLQDMGAFVKAAAYDAPKWLWEKAKAVVGSYWSKAPDAVSGASDAAEANVEQQRGILAKAREMYAALQELQAGMAKEMDHNASMFACLPPEDKSEIVCRTLTSFLANLFSGGAIVKGAQKGVVLGAALAEFVTAVNRTPGIKGLSTAEKVSAASGALANVEARGSVLRKIGNSDLVEYTNGKGEKYLKIDEYQLGASGERKLVSSREIMQDSKTLAIDANQEQGRKLLKKAVENSDDSSVIFVDVNNLGKTNYFRDGTKAGDDYLRGVGSAIRDSIGPDDMVFKMGGDELAIVVKSKDPKQVMRTATRVVDNVDRNHDARTVFKTEQKIQAQRYRDVAKAEKYEDIPEATATKLSSSQKESAQKDFGKFKDEYLEAQKMAVIEQAKYRPSVSIGSTLGKGDNLEEVLQRAEAQATQTKIQYKSEIGLDTSKYGGSSDVNVRPNYKAKPEVLEPAE